MFAPRATRSLVSLFTLGVVFLSLSLTPGGAMAATYVTDGIGIPPYAMHLEAFPNPFNSTAMVRFELPVAGDVRAFLFDVSGRQVALINGRSYAAGMHQIPVDGCLLPSGLYHVRLEFGGRIVTRSLVLIR